MIFRKNQRVEPRIVESAGIFGIGSLSGSFFSTEIWHCYNCGKVRAVRQWKRVRILEDSNEKPDPEAGGWTTEQLQSVEGVDLLPDGWGLLPSSDRIELRLLCCDECFEELKKQKGTE